VNNVDNEDKSAESATVPVLLYSVQKQRRAPGASPALRPGARDAAAGVFEPQ
jgi:hypothetical protein